MASTFTANKDLEKPGFGEQKGVWGQSLNTNFDKIDGSLGRIVTKSLISNPVISTSQTAVADFDAITIRLTGDISALSTRTLTFPATKAGRFLIDAADVTFGNTKAVLKVNGETRGVTITSASERIFDMYTDGTSVRRGGRVDNPYILDEIRMYAPNSGFVSSNLPRGWYVANGNNGTVNLTGRFIRATQNHTTWAINQIGGANITSVQLGGLSGSGFTSSVALTSAMIPPHKHPQFANVAVDLAGETHNLTNTQAVAAAANRGGGNDVGYSLAADGNAPTVGLGGVQNNSGTTGHRHAVSISFNSTTKAVSVVPAYYALIFIQYKG